MNLIRRLERLEEFLRVSRPSGECGMGKECSPTPGQSLPICGEHVSGCWMRVSPEDLAECARILVEIGQASTLSDALERLERFEITNFPSWRPPIEETKVLLGLEESDKSMRFCLLGWH